jgi:hypothetical protein
MTMQHTVIKCLGAVLAAPLAAAGAPSQEDVFRSIQQNLSEPSDPSKLLSLVFATVALLLLLVVLSYRRKREVAPRALNHPGKLLKEVSRAVNLRPAELRQLRSLAEDQQVSSPITLMLCPSVLARAVRQRPQKVDARLVSSVMRKLG